MQDEFLVELWVRLKPYINTKDRMDAADIFVTVIDEFGVADDLEDNIDSITDKHLKAALVSIYGCNEDDDEEEGW